MSELQGRIRRWTVFLIAGLVLSGATALPIATELEAGVALLGHDLRGGGVVPEGMRSGQLEAQAAVYTGPA